MRLGIALVAVGLIASVIQFPWIASEPRSSAEAQPAWVSAAQWTFVCGVIAGIACIAASALLKRRAQR
jgi:hypothetical protein